MPPRRDVVFLGASPRPVTGGEKYNQTVIDRLRAERRVDAVTYADLPADGRGYIASNRWLLARYRRSFRRLVVVEDHFWHPRTFAFSWVARLSGARVVCMVHHLYHRLRRRPWQRWVDRVLEVIALSAAHRVVVNSQSTADDVASLGVRRSRIVIIPPGVARIPDSVGSRPELAARPLRLLAVGAVASRKGLEYLLEALATVSFPFELDLAGDPDYEPAYRSRLEERIDSLGLRDRVRFMGRLDDAQLDAAHREADVFVAPSVWEGFGMAVQDALLYGLPIVATRVGGIPELVRDGEHGLLVPPRDPAALAHALERLAADPALRAALRDRARARGVEVAWTWERVGDAFASVVAEVAVGGNR